MNPWKNLSDRSKINVLKWAYIIIVVAATITLGALVVYNKNLVSEIQQDRKRVTYDACIAQNNRNIELINFVNQVALQKAREKAQAEGKPLPLEPPPMEPTTRKFINVLAKYRDCDKVIMTIFGSPINYDYLGGE